MRESGDYLTDRHRNGVSTDGAGARQQSRTAEEQVQSLRCRLAWAMQNSRKLTLERQFFLDDFDSLPATGQRQGADIIASLKLAKH